MYYNLQIIYNFTVNSKDEEQLILTAFENKGKSLEQLPYFEVKEIKRQEKALADLKR